MDNDLEEIVLSYPKLIERMNEKGIGKDKVLKNLNEIKAEFSKKYIKTLTQHLLHLYIYTDVLWESLFANIVLG